MAYVWSDDFQGRVLALLLQRPEQFYELIEPSYFANPLHVDICRVFKQVCENQKLSEIRVGKDTLLAVVSGDLGKKREKLLPVFSEEIAKLYSLEIQDASIVGEQVLQFAKVQKYREALVNAERDVNAGQFDLVHNRFKELEQYGKIKSDMGVELWRDLHILGSPDERGQVVPTGIPTLDRMMEGGAGAGELNVILAAGKIGKSTLINRLAKGAIQAGFSAAIASGELHHNRYIKRIASMITEKSLSGLWGLSEQEKVRRIEAVKRMLLARQQFLRGKLFIKSFPTGRASTKDIEIWVRQLRDEHPVDVLFVDSIMLFQSAKKEDERRHQIGQASVELRGIGADLGIPVWTPSQSNRAAYDKEVLTPKDFAEDYSQFWTLDFFLALCQTKDEAEMVPERARLIVAGARDVGHGGTIPMLIERDIYRFSEDKAKLAAERLTRKQLAQRREEAKKIQAPVVSFEEASMLEGI